MHPAAPYVADRNEAVSSQLLLYVEIPLHGLGVLAVVVRNRVSRALQGEPGRREAVCIERGELGGSIRKPIEARRYCKREVKAVRRHSVHLVVVEVRIIGGKKDGGTAADRSFSAFKRTVSKTKAGADIAPGFVLPIRAADVGCRFIDVPQVGDKVVHFSRHSVWRPAGAQIQRELVVHSPVVLQVKSKHVIAQTPAI